MIPDWLREKLASPPPAGSGIHAWLFSCARQLHAHMSGAEIAATLAAATSGCERRVTGREIRDAVNNSEACAWKRSEVRDGCLEHPSKEGVRRISNNAAPVSEFAVQGRWPKADTVSRRCRIAEAATDGVCKLVDLWERSKLHAEWSADDWLDWLFPGAEWLCLAQSHPAEARSRRREKWSFGPAEECGLVVPSPMTGPGGLGLDGRQSHRCLDNTGPRRWLVIEFDPKKWKDLSAAEQKSWVDSDRYDAAMLDEQAGLHWALRTAAMVSAWPTLCLCVYSAGRSLHGWYGPVTDEGAAHELMAYAVSIGADPATWNRCQLVRLPGGRRKTNSESTNTKLALPDDWPTSGASMRQEIFFFDPNPCQNLTSNSLAHGAPVDSTLLPVSMAA